MLANSVASQIDLHQRWGGVVPEAAARAHVEAIVPMISEALLSSRIALNDIRAVAVTNRPGLIGALSVGVTAAKAMAFRLNIPLLGVHHLEGHLCSPYCLPEVPPFPHVSLVVSGGHTELVLVEGFGQYRLLGETIDDAAGEAFDKGARLLGLGYPGGVAIQESALRGNSKTYSLPKGLSGDTTNFSFSGLKTAMLRLVEKEGSSLVVPDAAAALQETITGVLCERAIRAAEDANAVAMTLVGGVAANLRLRKRLAQACERAGLAFFTPPINLCTDNAAMIGIAASWRLAIGETSDMSLEPIANSDLVPK